MTGQASSTSHETTPRARFAVTALFVAHGALIGTWVARIPAIKDDLDLSEGGLGLVLLCATLGGFVFMPLAGWVVAHEGSRATARQSMVAMALLLPALAWAPNPPLLAVALFAFGAALGATDVAMNAHGLVVEGRYGRPILSSFHAGWSFGGLVGAGVGAIVAWVNVDPLPHFGAAAVVFGAIGLVGSAGLLPSTADRPEAPPRFGRPPRRLAVLAALAFCGLLAEGAVADWGAVYLAESLQAGAAVAALGFAAFSVAMAAFRLLGDPLTSRWGPVAVTRRGGALAGGALAVALLAGHPAVTLVAFACMGAGIAALVPIFFRAGGSLPGVPASVGIAALTTAGYTAFLVGPPAIGFAAEAVGLPLALGLVVVLLALLVAFADRVQPTAAPGPQPA
jgi:MFS family permease